MSINVARTWLIALGAPFGMVQILLAYSSQGPQAGEWARWMFCIITLFMAVCVFRERSNNRLVAALTLLTPVLCYGLCTLGIWNVGGLPGPGNMD